MPPQAVADERAHEPPRARLADGPPSPLEEAALKPAIFLDRDGTIVRDVGYPHRLEDLFLLDGAIAGLRLLHQRGWPLFIVSNQSGIARGLFTEADAQRFQDALDGRLQAEGIILAGFYYCPYHPTEGVGPYRVDSPLRKPGPGMLLQAAQDHDLDLSRSWMIGDKRSDVLAGQSAGCRTILLRTGKAGLGEPDLAAVSDHTTADLREAAEVICRDRDTIPRARG